MSPIPGKMREAVLLAGLWGPELVDQALTAAAQAGRFGDRDLVSIASGLHRQRTLDQPLTRADDGFSTQPGTAAWKGFGE